MSSAAFSNMDNMNSIYSIGHNANFKDGDSGSSGGASEMSDSGGGSEMSAFGNMFESNEDLVNFIQRISTRSNTIHILLPAIDQIFQTIQNSPFAGLESVGILNFADPFKAVGAMSNLPKPLSPVTNQKGQSR
ncbi:MAG: hypothetical protein K0R02_153 [Rickettsiaceae bacterium]|jgi:hypothetical protein|nr:hypothetical protein [Rickettsiaceae bacterium]